MKTYHVEDVDVFWRSILRKLTWGQDVGTRRSYFDIIYEDFLDNLI